MTSMKHGPLTKCSAFIPILLVVALICSACSKELDSKENKENQLSRANEHLASGQYEQAEKEFRDILRSSPNDAIVSRQLGIIYYDQGRIVQAVPLLKKAAEQNPEDTAVQLKLGLFYLAVRDYQHAREAALRVLEKEPGQEEALLLLVETAMGPNEFEDTRSLIQTLQAKDQQRSGYHVALAALNLRQKDDVQAEAELKVALNLDPRSSLGHMILGNIYWTRNDLTAADQAFKTAAEFAPLRSEIRMRYADFKFRTGTVADAKMFLEDLSQKAPDYLPPRVRLMIITCAERQDQDCTAQVENILIRDPVNYAALFQSGTMSLSKGDANKALRAFTQLVGIYTKDPKVFYQLARASMMYAQDPAAPKRGEAVENAEKYLDQALTLDPNFDQAKLLLAELKMKRGSPAAAADLLLSLTKERPNNPQAQLMLASAYLAQQKKDEALAVYREMAKLFPQDPQPPFLLGMMLLERGQRADAREAFEKSVKISPNYLPAVEKLVDLDIGEKQYAIALERVQQITKENSSLALPLAFRAKIYFAQGDVTQAELDLLKAVELDPKLEGAYVLLAQLYTSTGRSEQAVEKLSRFVEQKKSLPTLMQLGTIQLSLKQYSAARDTYEKLLTLNPGTSPLPLTILRYFIPNI